MKPNQSLWFSILVHGVKSKPWPIGCEQLNILYTVPKKIAPAWVNKNRMLLLLDGLDEVKPTNREESVESINQFRSEHGLTSLIVCSRIQEYEGLNNQLALEGAVSIQPLTSKQVDAYFSKFGESLATVKQLLKGDQALLELAETPLILSIMTLAYRGVKANVLPAPENIEEHRKHIFNTYIERMLARSTRAKKLPFTKDETLHYLHWLAFMNHSKQPYRLSDRRYATFLVDK